MTFAAFLSILAIHLAAVMSPGPSFVVSVRVAASDGFWAAACFASGVGLGGAFWAASAITGLALAFQLLPNLLIILKVFGGVLLIWIAWNIWRQASQPFGRVSQSHAPMGARKAFRLGVMTAASNAKTVLFFGAVFAGLIPQDTSALWMCAIVLAVFVNETLWYVFVARAFSLPGARAGYIRLKSTIDRAFGGLIALFGLKIALS